MPTRDDDWYDTNGQQPYPVSELASGTGDDGETMRDDVVVDLHLRFPSVAGNYAYLGGLTVTENIVSLVIAAADEPDSVSGFTPLAAITVAQPVTEGQHYALTPLYPGTGGWVVFGSGVRESFVGRYSTPQQSLLLPRCARPYRDLPVASLGKVGKAVALTGLVTIRGGTDIAVVKETRTIYSIPRDVLVIRLRQDATGRNVLADYVSECQTRPESRNCPQPGIETINGVSPDCDGNINLVFEGNSLYIAPFQSCGPGITLDSRLSLAELCAASNPTRDPQDLCESVSDVSLSESIDDGGGGGESEGGGGESEVLDCTSLPFTESFASAVPTFWSLISGQFLHSSDDSPSSSGGSTVASSGSERNILLFNHCDASNIGRTAIADLRIMPDYSSRNGGLIMNYHVLNPASNPKLEYFMVVLDQNLGRLQVLRFSGNGTIVEYNSPPLQVLVERWYRIACGASSFSGNVLLDINVYDLDGASPGTPILTAALSTTKWMPGDGRHGVTSYLSSTQFGQFAMS